MKLGGWGVEATLMGRGRLDNREFFTSRPMSSAVKFLNNSDQKVKISALTEVEILDGQNGLEFAPFETKD